MVRAVCGVQLNDGKIQSYSWWEQCVEYSSMMEKDRVIHGGSSVWSAAQ